MEDLITTVNTTMSTFTEQGSIALIAIAAGMFTLAGLSLLIRWVKASFFS